MRDMLGSSKSRRQCCSNEDFKTRFCNTKKIGRLNSRNLLRTNLVRTDAGEGGRCIDRRLVGWRVVVEVGGVARARSVGVIS